MRRLIKIIIVLLVLGGGAAMVSWARAYWSSRSKPNFRTAVIARGDITWWTHSTGTVQPEKLVKVGSVVSGPIKQLYVDFNSEVKQGDMLAEIDPRIFQANVNRDMALCASAKADVARVTAQLEQARKRRSTCQRVEQEEQTLHLRNRDGQVPI